MTYSKLFLGIFALAAVFLSFYFADLFSWVRNVNLSPTSLTAETGAALQFESGTKVKVIVPESRTPPVEFEALAKGEKTVEPQVCLDASGQRTFDASPQTFLVNWEKEAKCARTITDATVLKEEIADLKQSVAVLKNLIASRELSLKEIMGASTLDSISLSIIPVGEEQNKTYTRADNIAMACLENATGSATGVIAPFGVGGAANGTIYAETSPRLDALTGALKQKNLANHKAYTSAAEKNSGKVSKAGLDRLSELEKTLEKDFMVATQSALSQFHPGALSGGDSIALAVTTEKGADGKEQRCNIPILLNAAVRILGVRGDFLKSTVTVDGRVYEHDCIPQAHLLKKMKDRFAASIADFQKKKAKYEAQLRQTEQQLAALKTANYGCGISVAVVPANGMLRANGSDGPVTISRGDPIALRLILPPKAVTCTANWTRDIINAQNKTGISVLSYRSPSTLYTLSCTDKNGKLVGTDSVEVRTEDYKGEAPTQPILPPLPS